MAKSAPSRPDPLRLAVGAILLLTAWRLALLPFSRLELYVDEAQYWLWGQEMAFGAYSKPPLVGWMIRTANELTGSDAPWVARLPWPVCHATAALAIRALAARLLDRPAAALAGAVYASLPAVSLGSILVSTDSPMLMCLALTLLLWHRQAGGAPASHAVALGATIGFGFMAKYAMLFALPGLALASRLPGWNLRGRDLALTALTALLVLAPNLVWNLQHDMATWRHTVENADFRGLALHPLRALRFLAEQFAVAGPLALAAMLAGLARRDLLALSLIAAGPLLICTAQALNAGANANWAVGAYVPGAILAAAAMQPCRSWRRANLALNGAIALALPVIATQADRLHRADGSPLLDRYVGREAPFLALMDRLPPPGPTLILSDDRAVLAQLFYLAQRQGRRDLVIRALPPRGRPARSHYELIYPLDRPLVAPAWLIARHAPACAGPARPFARGLSLHPLPPACLAQITSPPED